MMCDDCGINQASIHITTIVNGEKQDKDICNECMEKLKASMTSIDLSNLTGLLSGFFEKAKEAIGAAQTSYDLQCEQCGTTYKTFEKNGLLGCASCYQAFREPLSATLTRIHGNIQHTGRIPEETGEETSLRFNVEKLKMELKQAVADEEYEIAAGIRDHIKELNEKLAGGAKQQEGTV